VVNQVIRGAGATQPPCRSATDGTLQGRNFIWAAPTPACHCQPRDDLKSASSIRFSLLPKLMNPSILSESHAGRDNDYSYVLPVCIRSKLLHCRQMQACLFNHRSVNSNRLHVRVRRCYELEPCVSVCVHDEDGT
jgi:hypothetical protein